MSSSRMGRRRFLTLLGGAGGLLVAGSRLGLRAAHGSALPARPDEGAPAETPPAAPTGPGAEVDRLLGGLHPGSPIPGGTVVAVHSVRMGAIPLVLRSRHGDTFQVDILARDRARPALAETAHLALCIANRGDGSRRTDELHGRMVKALAARLAQIEARGARSPALLTLAQRVATYPAGRFGV